MWLFILFVLVPIIEIGLFIQIGGSIGILPTLLIVILTAALGTWLVRNQGLATLSSLKNQVDSSQNPTQQLAHGAMILFAGALLLTPGFFTDGFGFLLLIQSFRDSAFNYIRTRITMESTAQSGFTQTRSTNHQKKNTSDVIIEGEFYEDDESKD